MNPYCTRIRVLLNAVHIDSLLNCVENQFYVDNSTTNSSIIDSLFRSLRNCFDIFFYSFLDSITLRFPKYSECCEELLCWGLGECSTCLFTNVLCKSSNLNLISLLLLFLDSICHLKMNIVLLVIIRWSRCPKEKTVWSLLWLCILIVRCLFK